MTSKIGFDTIQNGRQDGRRLQMSECHKKQTNHHRILHNTSFLTKYNMLSSFMTLKIGFDKIQDGCQGGRHCQIS